MAVCVSAHSSVNWSADFESPPYVLEPINGQQGWWASSPAPSVIADGTAPSGSQVLYIAGPNESGNAIGYPDASAELVECTAYVNGPTGAGGHAAMHWREGSTYFVHAEFQESGDDGWGYYNIYGGTGNQWAGSEGAKISWSSGTWEKLEIRLDLVNDRFAVVINDVLVDEWYDNSGTLIGTHTWTPFVNEVSRFDTWQFFIGTMHATGTPYKVDGLVVEEIDLNPEVTEKQAGIMLRWKSVPGVIYSIYSVDNLSDEWQLVEQITADSSETTWVDVGDDTRENPASDLIMKRYYQILIQN